MTTASGASNLHTPKDTAERIRTRLRAARAAMTRDQRLRDSGKICDALTRWIERLSRSTSAVNRGSADILVVAGFWPLEGEPDITPAMRSIQALGITTALPLMAGAGKPLEFHRWKDTEELLAGPFGVMQPRRREPVSPGVILVPTLGYTANADRIGYGAGFYDRTLAALAAQGRAPVTIGIGWREGLIEKEESYVPQPHDFPLTAVLAPDGWLPREPNPAIAV